MTPERWLQLMEAWGFSRNEDTFSSLLCSYSQKGRRYHTIEHVDACLQHLDRCVTEVDNPREVEVALWFHDAIYKPLLSGNERKSADWASSFLSENGAAEEEIARVHQLIVATEHNAPTQTKDESILVDIDLSILGSSPEIYEIFEQGVRKEYQIVPWFIYRRKRIQVLQGFLERSRIYENEPFSTELEKQAKENLANAVSKLETWRK